MVLYRYSQWDGSQSPYSLDAEAALDELSKFMLEGLSAEEALEWMQHQGFEMSGMDFRVMGLEELMAQLRKQARERMASHNMDHTFDPLHSQLEEILDREEQSVRDSAGVESNQWNDFNQRRDEGGRRVSEMVRKFEDYDWTDDQAAADFQELVDQLQDIGDLEDFYQRNRNQLQGGHSLDFDEALELMREIERLSQMARDIMEGNFETIPMEELAELLGEEGAQSLILLRDLRQNLEDGGFVRDGENGLELTPRAIRKLGELALEDIYAQLQRGAPGAHETSHRGIGELNVERTKPYVFGEPMNLDAVGTLKNALFRGVREGGRLAIEPDDLRVFEADQLTETTTVLLLDMSWSMSWSGRWAAAKRVAIAMDHLIRTRYPKDYFSIVGFYTRARELHMRELPELSWNMADPFTNLQDGLREAQRLIDRHPSPNAQVIVITDGQPTAYFLGDELRVEWPNGVGGTSPRANRETLREVQRVTKKGITINTFMLDDAPELLRFVEAMTRINRGRAFYTTPDNIGDYIMVDYLSRKKRRIG